MPQIETDQHVQSGESRKYRRDPRLPRKSPLDCIAAQAQQPPPQAPDMTFFVTSAGPGKGADLGGLEGADRHCQMLAQTVGAGGKTWHAYLSAQAAGIKISGFEMGCVKSESPAMLRIAEDARGSGSLPPWLKINARFAWLLSVLLRRSIRLARARKCAASFMH